MLTRRQAKSFYERAYFRADKVWYGNVKLYGKEKANQIHQDYVQKAWDKYGSIING